jgi:hypothetical protein
MLVLAVVLAVMGAPVPAMAAGSGSADDLQAGLTSLVGQLTGSSLSPAKRAQVHAAKAQLIASAFDDQVNGVSAARVISDFDCVSTRLQQARNTKKASVARARISGASACRADLAKGATAKGLSSDLVVVKSRLGSIAKRAKAGRSFGSKVTALRKVTAGIVAKRFAGQTLHGVSFSDVYDDLECIDVKVESGRTSGAASCAKRLLRRTKTLAPAKPPVMFGSDLTGTPVSLPTTFDPEDTEFWTGGVTVPAAGTITAFKLRTGDSPVDLPLRFSVVRPRPDGQVTVITTTNPVYPLKAHDASVHTYLTSALSFACCKVQAGDIVTIDNSGTTTPKAYVWFAASPGVTTFSHTTPPGTNTGHGQDAGQVWAGTAHDGYEVLLQVVLQPS